jgi:nickel transport protein
MFGTGRHRLTWQYKTLMNCWILIGLSMLSAAPAFAHGADYQLLDGGVVGVSMIYESGQPMAGARVLIFAPGDKQAELTMTTDRRGVACFAPNRAGIWVLEARAEGGHLLRINLEIEEPMLSASVVQGRGGFSTWQKLVVAACVIWALVATALVFRSRKKES